MKTRLRRLDEACGANACDGRADREARRRGFVGQAAAIALALAATLCAQDLTTYRPTRELNWSTQRFNPSADGKVVICDKGVLQTSDWSLTGEIGMLKDIQFSTHPDYLIAITHSDGLWIYSSKTYRSTYPSGIAGAWVSGDISPDGKHVIVRAAQKNGLAVVTDWDQPERKQEMRACDTLTLAAFTKRDAFVTVSRSGQVALWNLKKAEPTKQVELPKGGGEARLSPDKRAVYVLAADGLHRVSTSDLTVVSAQPEGLGAGSQLELSPKGKYVAVFSEASAVSIYESDGLKPAGVIGGKTLTARCVSFTPDERMVILGHAKLAELHFFKAPAWEPLDVTTLPGSALRVVVAPDQKWMVVNTTIRPFVLSAPKKK